MGRIINDAGEFRTDSRDRGEILDTRFADALQATEVLE
jgi:hypothetical protein